MRPFAFLDFIAQVLQSCPFSQVIKRMQLQVRKCLPHRIWADANCLAIKQNADSLYWLWVRTLNSDVTRFTPLMPCQGAWSLEAIAEARWRTATTNRVVRKAQVQALQCSASQTKNTKYLPKLPETACRLCYCSRICMSQ